MKPGSFRGAKIHRGRSCYLQQVHGEWQKRGGLGHARFVGKGLKVEGWGLRVDD